MSNVHGLNHQHSACENCRAKKLKCSGQRPYCRRCMLKAIPCHYPVPEARRRKTQNEDAVASRQAASAARSRKMNEAIPHELQGVFSVNLTDLTPPRNQNSKPPQHPVASTTASNSPGAEEISTDPQNLLIKDGSDLNMESPKNDSGSIGCPGMTSESSISGASSFGWAAGDMPDPSLLSPMSFDFDMDAFEATGLVLAECNGMGQLSQPTNHQDSFGQNLGLKENATLSFEKTLTSPRSDFSGQNAPSADNQSGDSICQCFEAASRLLERWEARKHDSLDGLLKFQKATVYQLGSFLACHRCSRMSAFMMLPLLMCEKLVSSSPLILAQCSRSNPNPGMDLQKRDGSSPSNGSPSRSDLGEGAPTSSVQGMEIPAGPNVPVSFGEYNIESPQEWQSITEVLILFQFTQLSSLLERYRSIAVSMEWQTQLALVVDLQKKLESVLQSRRSKLDEAINTC